MSALQEGRKSARLEGIVRLYFNDEGRGYIHAGSHDYQFGLTDVIGTLAPEIGDRVQFSPQLDQQTHRARRIVLARNPQYIDMASPGAQYRSVALSVRPVSEEIVRQRRTGVGVEEQAATGPIHMRCFDCQKLVVPKRVKARPGLLGQSDKGQWRHYCPRCKASLDDPQGWTRMKWAAALFCVMGLYYASQAWWS